MGVDYGAEFGIGVEIEEIDFDENSKYDGMYEYLADILKDTEYEYSRYGSGNYTGSPDTWIITMKNPFKDGYDISEKVIQMQKFLKEKNVSFDKVDLVGGLLIW